MPKPSWAQLASSGSRASSHSKPAWAQRCNSASSSSAAPAKRARTSTSSVLGGGRTWSSVPALLLDLEAAGLPRFWLHLVSAAAPLAASQTQLCGMEIFSGEGRLSDAFRLLHGPWGTYELKDDAAQNVLDDNGMVLLLAMLLRIGVHGLVWLGTPCSSWVCLSRAFTKRTLAMPQGPIQALCTAAQWQYLQTHNEIAYRSALIAKTAHILKIDYIIEQPMSSLLFRFQSVATVIVETGAKVTSFEMSAFHGESPKPLRLVGTAAYLKVFKKVYQRRRIPRSQLAVRLASKGPGGTFSGQADVLLESSGYTASFGTAIALCAQGLSVDDVLTALADTGM